jgi:ABC-2 type transport system ATP-binding protein
MDGPVDKVNRSRTGSDFGISVSKLDFAYLKTPVLKGVDFRLEKGAVGLLGPNGSGKTTLLRCLLGQVPLRKSHVAVLGWDMAHQARNARAGLGWMPETGGIIPGMSGVGLVAYMGELSGMPARDAMQRAHEVLHYVGLADERYRPCDKYDLARNKGLGVILSTHLLADVETVCQEILVLRQGELLAREQVGAGTREPRQVFEVEGFGDQDAFVQDLSALGAEINADNRLLLVTLDLTRIAGAADGDGFDTAAGVRAILDVARRRDFALRRLRRRPVTLADEFYRMVEA